MNDMPADEDDITDDDFPFKFDPNYEREIMRRIEAINRGEAKMLSLEEVMRAVRERRSRRRSP